MRHNTPLYMFNKDNMEHATQVKQGQGVVFGVFVWQRWRHIPKFSEDSRLKFRPCEMLAKQVLNTVTLFLQMAEVL